MKKRLIALLMVGVLCTGLIGCGKKAKNEEFVVDEGKLKQTETVEEVAEEAPAEEPTESTDEAEDGDIYTVALSEVGPNKVKVIKAVREITGDGLKEAKDLVDSIDDEPAVLVEKISKEGALEMKATLEAEGATVIIEDDYGNPLSVEEQAE